MRQQATTADDSHGNSLRLAYSEQDLDAAGILSRSSRWRLRGKRRFPEPLSAAGRKLYRAGDIERWLQNPEAWRPPVEPEGA